MKNQNFEAKITGYTRLFFKSLEERVQQLEKELEAFAQKQGIKDAIHDVRHRSASKPHEGQIDENIRLRIKPLYDKVVSTFAQYETEGGLRTFIQEALRADGGKSEVFVELTPQQQQMLLHELAAKKQRLIEQIESLLIQQSKLKVEKEDKENLLGSIPLPRSWASYLYYPFMAFFAFGEFYFNDAAFANISDSMTGLGRLIVCTVIAVSCAVSAHLIGLAWKTLNHPKGSPEGVGGYLYPALFVVMATLFCVGLLRAEDTEWYLVLINAGCIAIAIGCAYLHADPEVKDKKAYFAYEREEKEIGKLIERTKDELQSIEQKMVEAEQALHRSNSKDLETDPKVLREMEITLKQMEAYKQELMSRLSTMYDHTLQVYRTAYSNTMKRNR